LHIFKAYKTEINNPTDVIRMYKILFTIFFFVSFNPAGSQIIVADKIVGEWINEEKDTRIEIYKNGEEYFGRLLWSEDLFEADGKTSRKDVRNSNEKLRTRNLLHVNLLNNFVFSEDLWDDGKMYDPKSGKTYNCLIKLRKEKLEVRSYVGIPLLGRSTYWDRVP
jgi:uncharacterized protein (DUF2147 family)